MSAPAINYHGEQLPAFACKICGALDTDANRLAVHEQRHAIMQMACRVVGKVRVSEQIQCITPGCKQIQKARGLCRRCYARAWARGRIHG